MRAGTTSAPARSPRMPLLTSAMMPYVAWFAVLLAICVAVFVRNRQTSKVVVTGPSGSGPSRGAPPPRPSSRSGPVPRQGDPP